jgi:hypothetical protein
MDKYIIIVLFVFLNFSTYGQEAYNFLDLQWKIGENEIEEAHIADEVKIKFKTINIPDNEIIDIEIWEKTDCKLMDFITKLQGIVINGIVELNWIIEFDENNESTNYAQEIKEKGYTFIDYVFVIKNNDIVISSGLLSIMDWIKQLVVNKETQKPIRNQRYFIITPDDETIEGYTNDKGYVILERIKKIGKYRLII